MDTDKGSLNKRNILVVEDEEDIVRLLVFHLEKEGYRVHSAGSGPDALALAFDRSPDLIILDIMLPEMDGLEVCRRLRADERTVATPVIILSARKEELDKVLGLELGADDYMIKPFSVRELVSRVRAMLRRQDLMHGHGGEPAAEEQVLSRGTVMLDPQRHLVTIADRRVKLTLKEFEMLRLLMQNAGKVLSRDVLLDKVWGYEVEVDTRTVDVHVRYLRQKVEEDPAHPRLIETVRGVGYRFTG